MAIFLCLVYVLSYNPECMLNW